MRIIEKWKLSPWGWKTTLQQLILIFDKRVTKYLNDTV